VPYYLHLGVDARVIAFVALLAFVTAIVGGVSALSGIFAGPLSTWVGWPVFFAICFLASVPSLVMVFFVPKTPIESAPAAAG